MGASAVAGEHVDMRRSPYLNFHRAAEAAGYPALLIISSLGLGLVVASVAVLGVTLAGWALALALPSLIVALAVLAGAIDAASSDVDESAGARAGGAAAPEPVATLAPGQRTARQAGQDLKAA
jgi:hypothetical protein